MAGSGSPDPAVDSLLVRPPFCIVVLDLSSSSGLAFQNLTSLFISEAWTYSMWHVPRCFPSSPGTSLCVFLTALTVSTHTFLVVSISLTGGPRRVATATAACQN